MPRACGTATCSWGWSSGGSPTKATPTSNIWPSNPFCAGTITVRILHDLCRRAGRVILEIDPPEDEISRRRRGFYERNGFVYNEYDYIHPSYLRPPQPHRLMVMSYPEAISPAEFEAFRTFARGVAVEYTGR